MEIVINGKAIGIASNHSSVDSLIGEILSKISPGEIPSEFKINDESIMSVPTAENEARLNSGNNDTAVDIYEKYKTLESIKSISITTISIKSMLVSSINSSKDVLISLNMISTAAIEMFRLGREMEGNKLLEGMVYFIEFFIRNIDNVGELIKNIGKDPAIIFNEEDKSKFLDILTELKDSQLNMDDIMIADLIEYEVMPIIKKVSGTMENFISAL